MLTKSQYTEAVTLVDPDDNEYIVACLQLIVHDEEIRSRHMFCRQRPLGSSIYVTRSETGSVDAWLPKWRQNLQTYRMQVNIFVT